MWNRSILKERAKAALRSNYWKCVLVALIAVVILGGSFTYKKQQMDPNVNSSGYSWVSARQELKGILSSRTVHFALSGGLSLSLLQIFVFRVLEIGCDKFFLLNASGEGELGNVLDGFRFDYGKNVLTMFLVHLYITLWSFLLVIPGIVKAYAYSLVPYILADLPDLSRREAMELSCRLMNGNKMNTFILDLSFIGWEILNAFTCGILGVFYVNPYIHATKAELYLALRGNRRMIEQ